MALPQFEYLAPRTIGKIYNLLLELGSLAKVAAGAADLTPPVKDKAVSPEYLIDLERISDLDYLEYDEKEGLGIGALTALHTIETSPLVKEKSPVVVHVAKVVASTQIRAKGIMARNICNASPSCGTAPSLLTQGAEILIQRPNKDRIIQAEDFFLGVKRASLEPGEIVTGIVISLLAEDKRAAYIEHTVRKTMDLAIIGITVKIKVEDGICTGAHIALGAVTATPIRAPRTEEALIGKTLTNGVIVKASGEAMDSRHPTSNIHISAEYRKGMIRVFTKRAIRQAMECLQRRQENEAQYKFNR